MTINCDMGESFGPYQLGNDAACMPFVTHVNIACGFHASDPSTMWQTVKEAVKAGVKIGSHPGIADREGFGRRKMDMTRGEVAAAVLYQTGALQAFVGCEGEKLSHIKPHGALFGMAQNNEDVANGIADAALAMDLPVIGFANCVMSDVFAARGVPFACEFYADLDYDDNARQIITRTHHPVSTDDAVSKTLDAVDNGKTVSVSGKEVDVVADSICVHSDTPGALEIAKGVHEALAGRLTTDIV
ncbi:MAG: LamB/YcsF family protein [Hyphomicrobiaceae bacterium]|nr:LamB/YcsF family protein [Hyphomicrobiaceae bacterium]